MSYHQKKFIRGQFQVGYQDVRGWSRIEASFMKSATAAVQLSQIWIIYHLLRIWGTIIFGTWTLSALRISHLTRTPQKHREFKNREILCCVYSYLGYQQMIITYLEGKKLQLLILGG